MVYTTMDTHLGQLTLCEEAGKLVAVTAAGAPEGAAEGSSPLLDEACRQLDAYLKGERRVFDLPFTYSGTPFQERVWQAMREIPYGETCTYGEVAKRIGHPRAARAVGLAAFRNPLMLIVPCHRVICVRRKLGGFSAGKRWKQWLLQLENGDLFADVLMSQSAAERWW